MKIPHFVSLAGALCVPVLLATPAASETPVSLRSPSARSVQIFNAFHTQAPGPARARTTTTTQAPMPMQDVPAIYPREFRTFDGTNNNPNNSLLGSTETPFLRLTSVGYGDGVSTPSGADQLGPREISNAVNAQTGVLMNATRVSGFLWQWGQFVDHDVSLNRVANPAEPFNIAVPQGDPKFDPKGFGNRVLPFQRSAWLLVNGVRQQVNVNSAYLDGSVVYGSGVQLSRELRANDGLGHLKTSDNNLLPFNVNGFPNQPDTTAGFFLAGDVRANENVGLTALQTLFMREHNFWADTIKAGNPLIKDTEIYFRARAVVGAEIQMITYRDFLPLLLGPNALSPYLGYDSSVDPTVSHEFSTFAFRVGHSLLPPFLLKLNDKNRSMGNLILGQGFFNPTLLPLGGVEPFLRGLAKQVPQEVDAFIIDAVRNFSVGGNRQDGFDLAALNIQRGRDHGVPGYNQVRIDLGLAPKATFADMTPDTTLQAKLLSVYASPDDVDPWVGGLCEPHLPGAQVGEMFFVLIKDQFERLRDGDRFWYEVYLDAPTLASVQSQTLSGIIKRNAAISTELQDDVFQVPSGF
jgi:peroxidase